MNPRLESSLLELTRLATIVAQCDHANIEVSKFGFSLGSSLGVKPPVSFEKVQAPFQAQFSFECVPDSSAGELVLFHSTELCLTSDQKVALGIIAQQAAAQFELHHLDVSQKLVLMSSAKMSALGEMAGGIAHEINNPLAIIQGNLDKIKRLAESKAFDASMLHPSIQVAMKTVSRIAKIVHGLRNFARDGEQDPFEKVRVSQIVEDTFGLCLERFKNNNVKLLFDSIDPDLMIECRSVQITQVLLNLLLNSFDAVEFFPEPWVKVACEDKVEVVEISVTDCGTGLSTEIQNKIFNPFFTTKALGKGTGLGLSIAQGIVQSHGGVLFLDSQSKNTRFIIKLPKTPNGSA